eukprot:g3204.t1
MLIHATFTRLPLFLLMAFFISFPTLTRSSTPCAFVGSFTSTDHCDVTSTTVVNSSMWIQGDKDDGPSKITMKMVTVASLGKRRMFDVIDGGNLTLKNLQLSGGQLLAQPLGGTDDFYEYGAIVRVVANSVDTYFQAFDCQFQNGISYSGGGAVYANGAKTQVSMEGVSFTNNEASYVWGRGGAILVDNFATLEISQFPVTRHSEDQQTVDKIWKKINYIKDNSASHMGGAVAAINGGTIAIYGSPHIAFPKALQDAARKDLLIITGNSAGSMGGAVMAESGGNILLRGVSVYHNKAGYFGGALAAHTGTLRAEQSLIFNNSVTNPTYGLGGGIFLDVNARFINVNSMYVKDYEAASEPNYVSRSGVVGTDVTMAAEALHYDVMNMKQSPYGKDVDPVNPVSPNCVLLQIDIMGGNPVQVEVPLPLTSCDNDPGVCGRNNMIGPCSTNKTHPTYSTDCKCPLGSIRSTHNGCLKCPSNFFNDVVDATSCKPCPIWAPSPGFSRCSPPEEVGGAIFGVSSSLALTALLTIVFTTILGS